MLHDQAQHCNCDTSFGNDSYPSQSETQIQCHFLTVVAVAPRDLCLCILLILHLWPCLMKNSFAVAVCDHLQLRDVTTQVSWSPEPALPVVCHYRNHHCTAYQLRHRDQLQGRLENLTCPGCCTCCHDSAGRTLPARDSIQSDLPRLAWPWSQGEQAICLRLAQP